MAYHVPVLAAESIDALRIQPDGIYVDATFGGGGHAALILQNLGDKGRLLGFDQDEDAQANIPPDKRLTFIPHNFRNLQQWLRVYGIAQVDGILADLGVSSHQFDEGERGFSYRFDASLDMRMNRQATLTAADVLNAYSADELQRVFGEWGEVRNTKTLAAAVVTARNYHRFQSVSDLLAVAEPLARGERIRYLSQVFQALRIAVNDEMGALEDFLRQSVAALKPGGRLVVISYHSLEDRMVKHFLKAGNAAGIPDKDFYGHISRPFELVNKKPLLPSNEEIKQNPRARSAKLRAGERTNELITPHNPS